MKKTWSLLVAALMLLSMVAGCTTEASTENPTQPAGTTQPATTQPATSQATSDGTTPDDNRPDDMADEQILRIAQTTLAAGLFNPAYTINGTEAKVDHLVYDSLFLITPDYNFEPKLCTSYEISDDSRTFTLHLAENVKWHDGQPFTAKDVQFTIEFMADPAYPGSQFSTVSFILGIDDYKAGTAQSIEGLKMLDDYTIEVTTKDVYAPFFITWCDLYIIAEHIWGDVDMATVTNQSELLRNPIGTGPFKLERFEVDQYAMLTKNEDYFMGAPLLDKIQLVLINAETAQGQLLSGELDIIDNSDFSDENLAPYKDGGYPIYTAFWATYQDVGCNLRENELLQDVNVRKALMHALDRQGVCDTIYNGYAVPANTLYSPFFWAFPGNDVLEPYVYDRDKAIKILTETVGWEFTDGVMYANGTPVSFDLYHANSAAGPIGKALVVFQQNFKDIGIELNLNTIEFAQLLDMVRAGEGWDFYQFAMGTGKDANALGVFGKEAIGKGNNFQGYYNPRVEELLAEGLTYVEIEKRKEVYAEIAKIINDELPSLFICNWESGMVTTPKLMNYSCSPNYGYPNLLNWYLAK